MTPGRLYVMTSSEDWVKIGRSKHPLFRLKELQATGYGVTTLAYASALFAEPKQIERTVHKLLRHARTRGEKFKVSVTDAASAIERAIRICDGREVHTFPETPRNPGRTFSLRLDAAERRRLKLMANQDDRSIGYIIKSAISDYLLRREREASKRGVRR